MQAGERIEIGGERWEVIATYSRAQALRDGVLVNVSRRAARCGFRYPLAVTRGVWAEMSRPSPFCRRSERRRAFLRCFGALLRAAAWTR